MKAYLWQVYWRALLIHLPIIVCLLAGQWWAALICFGVTGAVMAYATLSPSTRLFGPVTTCIDSQGVLLTLDDGPDPVTTPPVLDLLDRYNAKAMFFLIGDRVQRWPELAQEIVSRGHAVGNHSQMHPAYRFWSLGPWRMWQEIAGCDATLKQVLGHPAVWFRAPVGHYNSFVHPALKVLGLRLMAWNCRGFDGRDFNVERVLGRIRPDLKPGAIVLLHEAVPTTLEVLEGALKMLEECKLRAVSLEEAGLCLTPSASAPQ
ncbi:MAG: acetyl xylan esterase [Verrucomicrobiaceae bacterium]|nr:acetyl xylan esterase [Verrucomicrobiaceae bacterium]